MKEKDITASFLARNLGIVKLFHIEMEIQKELPFELVLGISNKLSHMPLRWNFSLQHLENWNLNFDNSKSNRVIYY